MSLSPAISFDVSTITTRLRSSESTRAHSRSIVVLPTPGRPEQADRLAAAQHVEQNVDRAVDGAPDAAGEPDDLSGAITNRADAMQRLLDAGAIVGAEGRDARADVRDVLVRYRRLGEIREIVLEASLGRTPEIEHDFDDLFDVVETDERLPDREREDVEELGELPTWGNGMNSDRQY